MRLFGKAMLFVLTASALIGLSAPTPVTAQAATNLLTQDFNGGTGGWTIVNTNAASRWAVDATPSSSYVGIPYAPGSGPNSLNYNNTTTSTYTAFDQFGNEIASSGTATSPTVNLGGTTTPTLTFWCNFETEDGNAAGDWDVRSLVISNNNFVSAVLTERFGNTGTSGPAYTCDIMGTWHQHTIPLDPAWGSVQIRFSFDTMDEVYNDFAGWFVDQLVVSASSTGGPIIGGGSGGEGHNGDQNPCSSGVLATGGSPSVLLAVLALAATMLALSVRR